MIDLSFDQWLLLIIAFSLLRLCFLVRDGVVFLAEILEAMEEEEAEVYHPPYELEDGDAV